MSTDGTERTEPRPVPELALGAVAPGAGLAGGPAPGVTDEDRNRFGVLLDHAAERGLLSPVEYQARLAELADAASTDELQRIVTELPAFAGSDGTTVSPVREGGVSGPAGATGTRPTHRATMDPATLDSALWASLTPSANRRSSGNPWVVLAVLVAVLLVAMAALALIVAHMAHTHHVGAAGTVAVVVSRLRL